MDLAQKLKQNLSVSRKQSVLQFTIISVQNDHFITQFYLTGILKVELLLCQNIISWDYYKFEKIQEPDRQNKAKIRATNKMQSQKAKVSQHKCEQVKCEHKQPCIDKELQQKLNINTHKEQPVQGKQQEQEDEQQNEQNQQQVVDKEQQEGSQQEGRNNKWKVIEEPQKAVKLYMIDFQHCDAKKCSGKKLQRFKLLTSLDKKKKFRGIVLSAFGKKEASMEDLEYAEKYGVCVVDCSWNRIEQTREFRFKHERKLAFVTAGNPVNYGKPYQLSCAEALATALCSIGYNDQAQYIMSKFGWADGFWSLNPFIENYSKCKTLQALKNESKIISEKGNERFQRNYDLSDPQSSDEDN